MSKFNRAFVSAAACSIVISMLGASQALAESSVWSIHSGDNVLYLGGTVHLLRPGDYPLPEEFEQAVVAAASLPPV